MKYLVYLLCFIICSCKESKEIKTIEEKIPVILDTDTNNETDDQHALAYMLFDSVFDVRGITVNATYSGGDVEEHYAEAQRILKLCQSEEPLLKGANASFDSIRQHIKEPDFDGHEAVDFIIEEAQKQTDKKLVLLAIGKLTNVALAHLKDPTIAEHVRIVWLGSNYPKPGEYNLVNDISAMNYLLRADVPFEMVMVRYEEPTGTDVVRIYQTEIPRLASVGPRIAEGVTGRHGGTFYSFGEYSVNLFKNIHYIGSPPSRALFDMAAVAIVKDPTWAKKRIMPAPIMIDSIWQENPDNERNIAIWENFDSKSIMDDFFQILSSE